MRKKMNGWSERFFPIGAQFEINTLPSGIKASRLDTPNLIGQQQISPEDSVHCLSCFGFPSCQNCMIKKHKELCLMLPNLAISIYVLTSIRFLTVNNSLTPRFHQDYIHSPDEPLLPVLSIYIIYIVQYIYIIQYIQTICIYIL